MVRLVKILQVGRLDYGPAFHLQKILANRNIELLHQGASHETEDILILVEHNPVYTVGIRAKEYSTDYENNLKQTGAEFYRTNRGGLVTFHGPGQLVAYPILNLKHFNPNVRWYVSQIEKTIIRTCGRLGLAAETSPLTGVWVGEKKICALGLQASRFITTHGLALNCDTDLTWFSHIVPCGIEGKGVTSLSNELKRNVTIEETLPLFLLSFSELFDCALCDYPKNDADSIKCYWFVWYIVVKEQRPFIRCLGVPVTRYFVAFRNALVEFSVWVIKCDCSKSIWSCSNPDIITFWQLCQNRPVIVSATQWPQESPSLLSCPQPTYLSGSSDFAKTSWQGQGLRNIHIDGTIGYSECVTVVPKTLSSPLSTTLVLSLAESHLMKQLTDNTEMALPTGWFTVASISVNSRPASDTCCWSETNLSDIRLIGQLDKKMKQAHMSPCSDCFSICCEDMPHPCPPWNFYKYTP
uniref:lipoyl(octanoyl) transferase n=1 Tax=Timema genevievae TaxID=629358 RepID=A0A7R9JNR5_TIMGE|nr:unnamed protein product [Timema genevievae]